MNIEVYRVGAAAVEALKLATKGAVQGVTSRGAFLRIADRIIYLTPLNYRSPFNLTMPVGDDRFEKLEPGQEFTLETDKLNFSASGITVIMSGAEVWQPPAPVTIISKTSEQYTRALEITTRLRQLDAQKGYLFLGEPRTEYFSSEQQKILEAALGVMEGYANRQREKFMEAAKSLVGYGGGLTPSGDDFLAGFFLYYFRRALSLGINQDKLIQWCTELTLFSFQKTTTISANRLMYTARGWSEDIFLNLVDHLFDPRIPFENEKVTLLTQIGHSSGVDTFMGIFYAIKSLLKKQEPV